MTEERKLFRELLTTVKHLTAVIEDTPHEPEAECPENIEQVAEQWGAGRPTTSPTP
jgi:hypothetical protein